MNTYDKNYPLNSILLKDYPEAVRVKGEQLYSLITDIENNRNTSSIKTTTELYPFMKELFVAGNTDIPRGLYFNHDKYWIGYNDYESLPTDVENIELGTRVTIDTQTFELRETEDVKVWCALHSFQPILFYDMFEYNNEEAIILDNRGIYQNNIQLVINNCKRINDWLPYVSFTKTSKMYTKQALVCPYSFTYTAMFDNITRNYSDEEAMNQNHNAVLMYIKDEFDNIHVTLAYDKYNHLFIFDKDKKEDVQTTLSENVKYQITLQYINEHLDIYIDNMKVKSIPIILKDKMIYFAIGHDMDYGRFCEGSFIVTEPSLYTEALTTKELMHTKNFPRTWNLKFKESYLDLTLDEKIKLKESLIDLKMLSNPEVRELLKEFKARE